MSDRGMRERENKSRPHRTDRQRLQRERGERDSHRDRGFDRERDRGGFEREREGKDREDREKESRETREARDKAREEEKVHHRERSSPFNSLDSQKLKDEELRSSRFLEEVITASWNFLGSRIACSKTDSSLRVWGMKSIGEPSLSKPLVVNKAHERPVESISWKPGSETTLATVGKDKYVKIWNSVTGNTSQEFVIEGEKLFLVSYSSDAKFIACVGLSNDVFILDSLTGEIHQKIKLSSSVHSITWNNSSEFLFAGLGDGSIAMYYLEDGQFSLLNSLNGHRSTIKWMKVDSAGKRLYAASNEGVVSVWSLLTLNAIKTFGDVDQPIGMVDVSSDSKHLVITYDGGEQAKIFYTDSWLEAHTLPKCVAGAMTLPLLSFCPSSIHSLSFLYTTATGDIMVSWRHRRD